MSWQLRSHDTTPRTPADVTYQCSQGDGWGQSCRQAPGSGQRSGGDEVRGKLQKTRCSRDVRTANTKHSQHYYLQPQILWDVCVSNFMKVFSIFLLRILFKGLRRKIKATTKRWQSARIKASGCRHTRCHGRRTCIEEVEASNGAKSSNSRLRGNQGGPNILRIWQVIITV